MKDQGSRMTTRRNSEGGIRTGRPHPSSFILYPSFRPQPPAPSPWSLIPGPQRLVPAPQPPAPSPQSQIRRFLPFRGRISLQIFQQLPATSALLPCFQAPNALSEFARSRNSWATRKTHCASDQPGRAQTRPTPRKDQKIAAARQTKWRPQTQMRQRLLSQEQRRAAGSQNNRLLLVSGHRVKTTFWATFKHAFDTNWATLSRCQ